MNLKQPMFIVYFGTFPTKQEVLRHKVKLPGVGNNDRLEKLAQGTQGDVALLVVVLLVHRGL